MYKHTACGILHIHIQHQDMSDHVHDQQHYSRCTANATLSPTYCKVQLAGCRLGNVKALCMCLTHQLLPYGMHAIASGPCTHTYMPIPCLPNLRCTCYIMMRLVMLIHMHTNVLQSTFAVMLCLVQLYICSC